MDEEVTHASWVHESAVVKVDRSTSRYQRLGTIGSGGMGTVYLARSTGSAGFTRLVAMKRLHPHLSAEKDFVAMLVDEARLTSSLRHVNVMSTLDLVTDDGGFSMVLDYIEGAALNLLLREVAKMDAEVPRPIALALVAGILRGLDAVHDARGSEGQPLGIVHRDISPANVLVGVDGVPRIIDFGVAKAMGRVSMTKPGELRGKFGYMAPEQLRGRPVTRQADVYAVGVVLWELLTGTRLFQTDEERAVMRADARAPSRVDPSIPAELEAIVLKALAPELSQRWHSAREMLDALAPFERAGDDEVGRWVRCFAAEELARRAQLVQVREPQACRTLDDLVAEVKRSSTLPPAISAAEDAPRHTTARKKAFTRPLAPAPVPVPVPEATRVNVALPLVAPAPPPLVASPAPARPDPMSAHFGLIYMAAIAVLVVAVGLTLGALHRRRAADRAPLAPVPAAATSEVTSRDATASQGQIGALQASTRGRP